MAAPMEVDAAVDPFHAEFERALEAKDSAALLRIFNTDKSDDASLRTRELAVYALGNLYADEGKAAELNSLLVAVRPLYNLLTKAKTAKIVRTLFDLVGREELKNSIDQQITICEESIEWTRQEKRTFLRHRLQTKLADLRFRNQSYTEALQTLTNLLREVRRLDDKAMLVEVQLLESKVYLALKNISKSKAASVASRTAANAIYCPPLQQAALDLQSGMLNAQERDFKTAFSYFYEAFESYHGHEVNGTNVRKALKYMLLCRIMSNDADDVSSILSSKNALRHPGPEVDAMKAVAAAYKQRDLHEFQRVLQTHKGELEVDPLVASHLEHLYDAMLEQHLIRVIEPYSKVQIAHVATKLKLAEQVIETKLSQMILDKKLNGILDQGNACLIVFDDDPVDESYPAALATVENLSRVGDVLLEKWSGKFERMLEEERKKKEEEEKKRTEFREKIKKQEEDAVEREKNKKRR